MNFHRIATSALAAVALLAVGAAGARAWSPSAEAQRTLRTGEAFAEVLPDADGAALIRAAVDIPAPPRAVWAAMTDCRAVMRMIGGLESCAVLQGDPRTGWDVREQVTRGNLLLPDIHNIIRSDYQPYSVIRFRRAGGDLNIEDGEWRLEALNGGAATRVIYVNRLKTRILAPPVVVRAGLRMGTPKMLISLRREALAAAQHLD